MSFSADQQKERAGTTAVDRFVRSGMVVGLGTGSTAKYAVIRLAEKLKRGELESVLGVATSKITETLARELGIPLRELDEVDELAVTIDGADCVRIKDKAIVKGAGGALFREKMVAAISKQYVIIADESKICRDSHMSCALPVEVAQFGVKHTVQRLQKSFPNATPELRKAVTDNGNFTIDLKGKWEDIHATADKMKSTLGVLEHGLFLGLPRVMVVWTDAQGNTHEQ